MSESYVKEEPGSNFTHSINDCNISNVNNVKIYNEPLDANWMRVWWSRKESDCEGGKYISIDTEVKQENEPIESSTHEVLQKSIIENVEVKVKVIDVNNELVKGQCEVMAKEEIKPYQCSQCDKAFSVNDHLISHQKTHTGEKPYQCSYCDKAYGNKGNLNVHVRKHTGEKPYQCSQCDKAFTDNGVLVRHMRTHIGEKHRTIHTGKKYQCSQCDKCFSQNHHLKRHQKIHTGEKPYQCSYCDKAYIRKETLKDHLRTHQGVIKLCAKKYQCNHCDMVFAMKQELILHLRKHSVYQCNWCDNVYSQDILLIIHQAKTCKALQKS